MTRFPPHALQPADCYRLLAACGGGWIGERNRASFVLLWRTGLRVGELVGLDVDDLRRAHGGLVVRVRRPKGFERGTQPREVGLDPKAVGYMDRWAEVRGLTPGPLLPTRGGRRIDTSHFRRLLPALARRAAIRRRVHPHALRHSFACELWEETHDTRLLQLALGHASLASTQKYLVSIGATEVVATTTRRIW